VSDGRPPAEEPRRTADPWYRRAGVRWLLAAVTFVIGLFVGGIIVGFASSPAEPVVARSTVTMTPAAPPTAPAPTGSPAAAGEASVNSACLRAVNDAQSSYTVLGQLFGAVRGFDLGKLDSLIRRLQPMQAALKQDFAACHVSGHLAAPSVAPSASPSPTG